MAKEKIELGQTNKERYPEMQPTSEDKVRYPTSHIANKHLPKMKVGDHVTLHGKVSEFTEAKEGEPHRVEIEHHELEHDAKPKKHDKISDVIHQVASAIHDQGDTE